MTRAITWRRGGPFHFKALNSIQLLHFFFCTKGLHSFAMNKAFIGILIALGGALQAQSDAATKAKEHMFSALTGAEGVVIENLETNLYHGPWEALAYVEEDAMSSMEDIQEAVPDYYHFDNGLLHLKLVDPENLSEFGTVMDIPYKLENAKSIVLINPRSKREDGGWDILYLDRNYLALDMGEIRVFFIHSTLKE